MFSRPAELQLRRDPSARTLPWIIALMVFLAGLALGGMFSLGSALERWSQGLSGTLTVQLLPPDSGETMPGTFGDRLARTLEILRNTPGVQRAVALTDAEVAALLAPWLGEGEIFPELPLPKLVDVTLDTKKRVNMAELEARLAAEVPNALLDDHRQWIDRLVFLTRAGEIAAAGIVLLIGLAAIAMIAFTTRTGLAIHFNTIELLHIFGARDGYIANQFQTNAMGLGFRGGLAGTALAALLLAAAGLLVERLDLAVLSGFSLTPRHWIAIALLPFATAIIAMGTARVTVLRKLARMV